jgi:hypothetical protein
MTNLSLISKVCSKVSEKRRSFKLPKKDCSSKKNTAKFSSPEEVILNRIIEDCKIIILKKGGLSFVGYQ